MDVAKSVMLLPYTVAGDKGLAVMKSFAFRYCENGGQMIQSDVFDAEEVVRW